MSVESIGKVAFDVIYEDNVEIVYKVAAKYCGNHHTAEEIAQSVFSQIIYVFLSIFLYLLKCPQSLILSALRAFCFCGKPHISRSIFLYFLYQSWLKSW